MTQHADLKEVLKVIKMTVEESKAKKKRRQPKSAKLWIEYLGEFSEGKRSGWGTCCFKSQDVYNGFF